MGIKEVNEAYEAGKSHGRAGIISILKNLNMDEFLCDEGCFLYYDFNKWLDSLNSDALRGISK